MKIYLKKSCSLQQFIVHVSSYCQTFFNSNNFTYFKKVISYRLEHVDEPGQFVDLEANLTSYSKFEFYFFRENSVRTDSISKQSETSSNSISVIEPKRDLIIMDKTVEFNLLYLSKWSKVPFKIELSIDSLLLEETKTSHITLTGSKKTVTCYSIPSKYVCACNNLEAKNSKLNIL